VERQVPLDPERRSRPLPSHLPKGSLPSTEDLPSLNEACERFKLLDLNGDIEWAEVRPPSGLTEILKRRPQIGARTAKLRKLRQVRRPGDDSRVVWIPPR
jgi:hypothetical protein